MPTAPINMQPSRSIESSKISRSRLDPGGVTLNINAHSTALFAYQVLRKSSGILAIFAAIRHASLRVSFVVLCVMVLCVPMVRLAGNSLVLWA